MRSRGGRSHDDILLGMCVVAVGGVGLEFWRQVWLIRTSQ